MKRSFPVLLFIIVFVILAHPVTASAQQSNSGDALTDIQKLGRATFLQRCGVCHTIPTPTSKRYGPALYKDIVEGNEDQIRARIRDGSPGRMPGYKYTLDQTRIDAVIEYLKTVDKPAR